jgi:hypothetical protein
MSSKSFQELSPGQKLSLKGQLFELGKTLKVLDEEEKFRSLYSFQPNIGEFSLPNRQNDFFSNVDKAEMIRKVKKTSYYPVAVYRGDGLRAR